MLQAHTLRPRKDSRKHPKRVGRGDSSGHGSFSTRGVKGQNSRTGGGVRIGFEGGQTPLLRRMPKLRGFKTPFRKTFQVVNVGALNEFEDGAVVDRHALLEKKFIAKKNAPVKILGDGELSKKLTVKVDAVSASAKSKIEAAKGEVHVPEVAKPEKKG